LLPPLEARITGGPSTAPARGRELAGSKPAPFVNRVTSHPRRTVRTVKPKALLGRLLDGTFTNVSFVDAKRLLEALGFDELRVKGSHHVYGRTGLAEQLNLQDRGGQAKPYQLRQLVVLIRRYDLGIKDDQ